MIRVAACQATPSLIGFEERKHQVSMWLKQAEENQIDFICFPEGFLTGYYAEEELARKHCLEIQGSEFQTWLNEIKHFNPTIIIGFNEREGTSIFDSAAIIEKGKLLGIQRKHNLYHAYFSVGHSFMAFFSKGFYIGVAICLVQTILSRPGY